MIKKFNKVPFRWTIIIIAVVILVGAISLTNAKEIANNSPTTEDNNDSVPSQIEQVEEDKAKEDKNQIVESEEYAETEETQELLNIPNNFPQQPQVLMEIDMEIVESDQKQVDEGHSPWQLSPFAVTQTFVGLQISPDGIQGDFPIDTEDMKITYETHKEIIVDVSGDKSPISKVYLKKLIKQDENGIWTVVGYDLLN